MSQASPGELFASILGSPRINGVPVRDLLMMAQKERREIPLDLPVKIIDYMLSVCHSLGCEAKTRLVSVHLMNAFGQSSTKLIPTDEFLAIALGCVLIASKAHDHHPVSIASLQRASSFSLEREEIVCAELKILNLAGFEMHFPTPFDVLELILTSFGVIDPESEIFSTCSSLLNLVYTCPKYINGDWVVLCCAIVLYAADIVQFYKPVLTLSSSLLHVEADEIKETMKNIQEDCFQLTTKGIVTIS